MDATVEAPTAVVPTDEALQTPAQRKLQEARDLVIDSPEMEQVAVDELQKIKAAAKALEEERFGMTRPLDESKRKILAKYAVPLDFLTQAEAAIKGKVAAWRRKLEDDRRERQRIADEAARKERERLAQEARQAEAKAAAEAEDLRKRAAEAEAAGRTAEAAKLEARAESKVENAQVRAQTLDAAAASIPTSVAIAEAPKAKGVAVRTSYSAEITSLPELLAFVAANPMFQALVLPNQQALDAQARSLKDQFAIPGCKLVKTETVAARAA